MSTPLPPMQLKTPARLYELTQTQTAYGGLIHGYALKATIWGDFQPDAPTQTFSTEGEVSFRQRAVFICRSADAIDTGSVLKIRNFDWSVLAFDTDQDGTVRIRMERTHP